MTKNPERLTKTLVKRLGDKILITDECWVWTAAKYPNGYGHLVHQRRDLLAHVAVYELLIGSVPEGMDLDHLCHNSDDTCPGGLTCPHRACCRPSHLEPASRQTNIRRGKLGSMTVCKYGHSLEDALINCGRRRCRECNRLRCLERYHNG